VAFITNEATVSWEENQITIIKSKLFS
jgi:hypothetical protein